MKTLSDKIIRKYPHIDYVKEMILVEDVKEFIKELKENFAKEILYDKEIIVKRIDKLAGDKLI